MRRYPALFDFLFIEISNQIDGDAYSPDPPPDHGQQDGIQKYISTSLQAKVIFSQLRP